MAPEIYELETFTFAMDLFSLGLLFFYVLSGGTHAFGSTKEDRIIYIKMRKAMTLTLEQLKDVPGAVGFFEITTLMLSFIPEERPSAFALSGILISTVNFSASINSIINLFTIICFSLLQT